MADYHHMSEFNSAKGKYPIYRRLTVLETTRESSSKTRGIGINYVPVHVEPCVVLRGKWLRLAGFAIGQKVLAVVNQGEISLTPQPADVSRTSKE
ncbi:type I addiction module toxin, SymE family [Thalassomonas viridans]|uniref:Type I addiction module toxin, SymE family n=1 Tax=Thalassomonas viridans TaxID=137584 RepID=A0AAE9Z0G1_9GAMM|nr:SymE family type I addiction module toxin [Thalassomonas viridans]WDE03754.1 type I addiction module toxin, SymE family [Thalassomonas viridans]